MLTSFRSSVGPYGYQGSATPMSLDHQLRRMLGMSGISAGLDRDIYGGGKGLIFADSVASSLGEAVERMLGSFSSLQTVDSRDRMTASAAEMRAAGLHHVCPEDYDSYSDEQLDSPDFSSRDGRMGRDWSGIVDRTSSPAMIIGCRPSSYICSTSPRRRSSEWARRAPEGLPPMSRGSNRWRMDCWKSLSGTG